MANTDPDPRKFVAEIGEALRGAGPLQDRLSCAARQLEEDGSPGWALAVNEAKVMIGMLATAFHLAERREASSGHPDRRSH